jgi:hypothetical protein
MNWSLIMSEKRALPQRHLPPDLRAAREAHFVLVRAAEAAELAWLEAVVTATRGFDFNPYADVVLSTQSAVNQSDRRLVRLWQEAGLGKNYLEGV